MKKIVFLLLIVAGFALTSCNRNGCPNKIEAPTEQMIVNE